MQASAVPNAAAADANMLKAFTKFEHQPIVEQCVGCNHVRVAGDSAFCKSWAEPEGKWQLGICNFATHQKLATVADTKRINPLKAAKRAAAGKA
jgi:hypothetical protein